MRSGGRDDISFIKAACRKCGAANLRPSRPRGWLEPLLFVLGANLVRCHACADRNLCFAGLQIPARDEEGDGFGLVILAILGGMGTCAGIAFLVLRHFHRLPF